MPKVVDITEKLSFEENPRIRIKKVECEVNAEATTVLKIMGILSDKDSVGASDLTQMYELLFSESDREKIKSLGLKFQDFSTLVLSAVNLITGETEPGEAGTHTMT